MPGRLFFRVGLCALLCACGGNYRRKLSSAADGGCAEAGAGGQAACASAAGSGGAQAGSAARTKAQATRVARDGGTSSEPDAASAMDDESAQPDMPSKQDKSSGGAGGSTKASKSKPKSDQAGAGGAATKQADEDQAGQGGASEQSDDREQADCEQTCGPCQACGDEKSCGPVTGRDDADSCSDARSCSSRGECLHVSEAQAELGEMQDSAALTQSYAQVLTFADPATIQEIRLEVSCKESDQTFPAVWLAAAPGGIPSDTIIATANVLFQAPTDANSFALLELSKTIEEPAAGPIAIVVGQTDMGCSVRLNKQTPYPNGALFTQTPPLWTPTEGSMVFQVLSSQ